MAITHITVADRGLAAYLIAHGIPLKSFSSRQDNGTEFEFAMGTRKYDKMRKEYYDSPLKISLMKATEYWRKEKAEAKRKRIASRSKKVRPKTQMGESQIIPGRPKRMINL